MAVGLVRGDGSFRPAQNRHPSTDHQKIVTGDYVGDPYGFAKFGANLSTWGLLGKWLKYYGVSLVGCYLIDY